LAAEKAVRDVESIVAGQIHKERTIRTMGTKKSPLTGMYTPSMPVKLRGIPMTVIAGEADDTVSPAAAASAASGEA
jgi:alpha/beta superfamily hydrolase